MSDVGIHERKLAIWGTGKISKEFSPILGNKQYIYIDNDDEKRGKNINGTKVLIPDEIDDFRKYFIIIACMIYVIQYMKFGGRQESQDEMI